MYKNIRYIYIYIIPLTHQFIYAQIWAHRDCEVLLNAAVKIDKRAKTKAKNDLQEYQKPSYFTMGVVDSILKLQSPLVLPCYQAGQDRSSH